MDYDQYEELLGDLNAQISSGHVPGIRRVLNEMAELDNGMVPNDLREEYNIAMNSLGRFYRDQLLNEEN